MSNTARTLYQKIWDAHVVEQRDDGTALIYIDRHLVHEVTSPQAFEALRAAGRKVRRPDLTLAVPDHNLPTTARRTADGARVPIADFNQPSNWKRLSAMRPLSVSGILVMPMQSRVLSTLSGRSRDFRCRAQRLSAAIATLLATAG